MFKLQIGCFGCLTILLQVGIAAAQPSYCPTQTPTVCSGRSIGDILITLHGQPGVLGLNPNTRNFYLFSQALTGSELGDIAVIPSRPTHSVIIGDLDQGLVGIKEIDDCGALVSPTFGTFPAQLSSPLPPITKSAINNRGITFSPVSATPMSPGLSTNLLNGSGPVGVFFKFPTLGGAASTVIANGNLTDATNAGAVAEDELGSIYLGGGVRVSVTNAERPSPVEVLLNQDTGSNASMMGMVHDGNGHLFLTETLTASTGRVRRIDVGSGNSAPWTTNYPARFGGGQLGALWGVTMDRLNHLWVIESVISPQPGTALVQIDPSTGLVLDRFPIPSVVSGFPAGGNRPWGLAVLGVNLPAVREACSNPCGTGQIPDCAGHCFPAPRRGDGICDAVLNCYARGADGGDCGNGCAAGEVLDCNGHCGPKSWIGDANCNNGDPGSLYKGNRISYDCSSFRFDQQACSFCNDDEFEDCNGNCAPHEWFADGVCTNGGQSHLGNLVSFDCAGYNFDGESCGHVLDGSFAVTSDWGSGYCVALSVKNNAATTARNWRASFQTNSSTIYTNWNGTFSGNAGIVNVTPTVSTSLSIPSGGTDSSVGFCANRDNPSSGVRPVFLSATAQF